MAFLSKNPPNDQPTGEGSASDVTQDQGTTEVPLTRASAAWVGVSASALVAVLMIVFLVQNTHRVKVNFLWMSTSTSLALMLLIAAVGGILMTAVLGTARIVQLRRLIRGRGDQ